LHGAIFHLIDVLTRHAVVVSLLYVLVSEGPVGGFVSSAGERPSCVGIANPPAAR
jgi:hypothetical protein